MLYSIEEITIPPSNFLPMGKIITGEGTKEEMNRMWETLITEKTKGTFVYVSPLGTPLKMIKDGNPV